MTTALAGISTDLDQLAKLLTQRAAQLRHRAFSQPVSPQQRYLLDVAEELKRSGHTLTWLANNVRNASNDVNVLDQHLRAAADASTS